VKLIKFFSLIVLFAVTFLVGSIVSHAQTSLPVQPLPCNLDEIEPNDSMNTATSVCSNDRGLVYGELAATDVDYFREDNYFNVSDFTIDFDDAAQDVRLELVDATGKQVNGTVTSIYPYGTSYSFRELEMGTYYIKIYWVGKSTLSEPFKYSLKIKQKVYNHGWIFNSSYWEFWQNNIKYEGTKWINYKNQWFFLKNGARQQNGWSAIGAKWYYLVPGTGVMKTGWILDGGQWYLLDKTNGDMKTGWVFDGGKWYYLHHTGAMATGWIYDGGNWYFLNQNGDMATGWIVSNGKWYYLYSDGKMAKNTWVGKYRLGSDGAWNN
jgi:hypothetical protein